VAFDKLKNLFNVDIRDGVTGSAVVQSSSVPNDEALSYNVSMWLDVYVEGREPYRVKHECMVKAGKHPWPGTTLPVVVDRENPNRLNVRWDEIKTVDERMAEAPGPAAPAAVTVVAPQASGDMVEDRITKLERLAKLRDSGVLSEAEFDAEKARILAG
jgi:hypothetical protein